MKEKSDGRYLTETEIISIGKSVLRKTIGQIAETNEVLLYKGSIGTFIEKNVYNLQPNSRPEPDFVQAGIELKVTPFRLNQDKSYSAKERLVLNIINYVEEASKTFCTSSFWTKNSKLYILFYLWESNKAQKDFLIMFDYLLSFSDEDLVIIKRDWHIIHKKIVDGKAHEISEADTMYLAACTKGVNKESLRNQYQSDVLAKQRAYSLKSSYMTQLLRTRVTDKKEDIVRLISDAQDLEKKSFEEIIYERLLPFFGVSTKDLIKQFNIKESKNINEVIVARLLGVQGRVSQTEEFLKANIVPKTVRLEEDGRMIESMSFPTFRYDEISETDWEDSWHKDYFESTKFMFVIFKKKKNEYTLHDVKFWNMPIRVIENEFKDVWLHTQSIIKSGNIVREIRDGIYLTNFIKKSQHPFMHVRPHAQTRNDTYPLPVMDKKTGLLEYTKHCFWLNNNYVLEIIGNSKFV